MDEYKKSNREQRMTPKRVKMWCDYCDMSLVQEGRKCKVCGNKNINTKRLKKE